MNANDLADWLRGNAIEMPADWDSGEPINNMTVAADMLRSQQAQIEVLKAALETMNINTESLLRKNNG